MRRGVVAEFESADALARAQAALRREGYERIDIWMPYPAADLLATGRESMVPWIMLGGGLAGGALGYLVQWWINVDTLLIDVGGRPYHSAPAFIPITFESAVLASSLAGFVAMLWVCGLPRLHHPVFEVDGFESASVDRFWLGVDERDPRFDESVARELMALGALRRSHDAHVSRAAAPVRAGRMSNGSDPGGA